MSCDFCGLIAFLIILQLSFCNVITAIAVILGFQAEQPIFCAFYDRLLTYLWRSLLQADFIAFHVVNLFSFCIKLFS